MNFNELEQWLNERRVTEVECLVPDLTGVARGKILPRGKFTEDRGMRLPQAIVAMGVTGELVRDRKIKSLTGSRKWRPSLLMTRPKSQEIWPKLAPPTPRWT